MEGEEKKIVGSAPDTLTPRNEQPELIASSHGVVQSASGNVAVRLGYQINVRDATSILPNPGDNSREASRPSSDDGVEALSGDVAVRLAYRLNVREATPADPSIPQEDEQQFSRPSSEGVVEPSSGDVAVRLGYRVDVREAVSDSSRPPDAQLAPALLVSEVVAESGAPSPRNEQLLSPESWSPAMAEEGIGTSSLQRELQSSAELSSPSMAEASVGTPGVEYEEAEVGPFQRGVAEALLGPSSRQQLFRVPENPRSPDAAGNIHVSVETVAVNVKYQTRGKTTAGPSSAPVPQRNAAMKFGAHVSVKIVNQEEGEFAPGERNLTSPGGVVQDQPPSLLQTSMQQTPSGPSSSLHAVSTSSSKPGSRERVALGAEAKTGEFLGVFPRASKVAELVEMRTAMAAALQPEEKRRPESAPALDDELAIVPIAQDDGSTACCTVAVDRGHQRRLPWCGGYRDKRDGKVLLNAPQQTDPSRKPKKEVLMITRESQKPFTKRTHQQGRRDSFTQMDKPGIILDNSDDYELIPGPYFSADDWCTVRHDAAIIIQKYTRRDIARRTADRMRAYAQQRKEFWLEQERKRKVEADEHLRYEIQRRMNPRSGDDFEILYTELATWCAQELKKIDASGVTGIKRRKAVKELLLKEIKLLQTIDSLRCKAARENRKDRIYAAIEKMSVPKIWEMSNGAIVHVRTLGTARASDLMHLYKALAKPVVIQDERMGVLGYVKWTVQVFDCPLTREILDLIEREADLMNRGRPAKTLSGLRERTLNLFLQFVETPDFNPEATGFQYVPVDFDYGVNQAPTRRPGINQ